MDLADLKRPMSAAKNELGGPGWNTSTCPTTTSLDRFRASGDDTRYRVESAKMLGTFLHGMQGRLLSTRAKNRHDQRRFESIADYKDIESINMYREAF